MPKINSKTGPRSEQGYGSFEYFLILLLSISAAGLFLFKMYVWFHSNLTPAVLNDAQKESLLSVALNPVRLFHLLKTNVYRFSGIDTDQLSINGGLVSAALVFLEVAVMALLSRFAIENITSDADDLQSREMQSTSSPPTKKVLQTRQVLVGLLKFFAIGLFVFVGGVYFSQGRASASQILNVFAWGLIALLPTLLSIILLMQILIHKVRVNTTVAFAALAIFIFIHIAFCFFFYMRIFVLVTQVSFVQFVLIHILAVTLLAISKKISAFR